MKKILIAVILLLVSILVSCGSEQEEMKKIIRPVRYMQVYSSGGNRVRKFSGVSKSSLESNLSFKVAGTVERINVKVGDKVRKGDILAEIDGKDYRLQVKDVEAGLEQAKAQAKNAVSQYERIVQLYENRNASRNDLDAARAGKESAEAAVESIEKKLELAKRQAGYTKLISPVDGAVASVMISENENIQPGYPVIGIQSGSNLEVEIAFPEILIAKIREGDEVEINFDALPGKKFSGTITEVGVSSTGLATTFPVTVTLKSRSEEIRSGMAAEVSFRFKSSDKRERILVPPAAVNEDQQGKRFVYIVKPDGTGLGTVHRRNVEIGNLTESGLEIFRGLEEGELLITAGMSRLDENMTVRVPGTESN